MSAPEACWRSAMTPRRTAARPEVASTGGRIIASRSSHGLRRPAQSAGPGDLAQPGCARPGMPRERLAVDGHESERGRVAERPLEVVEQRPVEVAAHVDALGEARQDLTHGRVDVRGPPLIVGGGDAVLGDEDRDPGAAAVRAPDRAAKRLRVVLVAHLRGVVGLAELPSGVAPVASRTARSLGTEAESRVRLDPDEVVVSRQLEEPVVDMRLELERARARLRAVLVLEIGKRQRHARRYAGPPSDRSGAAAVRLEQVVDGALCPVAVVVVAWGVDPEDPAARAQALRLVDRARVRDPSAQRLGGAVAVALEESGKPFRRDAAHVVQPLRHGEVMEGDDGDDSVLMAGVEYPAVAGQLSARELSFGGFDARPFDAESERVEAESREHRDVVLIPVIEVAGVARRLAAWRRLDVLPPPPVGVRVAALGLVRGDRRAKKEAVRKGQGLNHSGHVSAPCARPAGDHATRRTGRLTSRRVPSTIRLLA